MGRRYRNNGHKNGWYHWYKAMERKIKLMRFQGKNMSVEGVYMYTEGDYPSLRHNSGISNQELDAPLLALEMLRQNGMKTMIGVEYFVSPQLSVNDLDQTSDREMWEGKEGLFLVDKHGRQLVGKGKSGVNFLHPQMGEMLLDCIGEIFQRYKDVGDVKGLFLVTGRWWAPGFITGSYNDILNTDVGYGDLTVGLFEKESGISLDVDNTLPTRFQKRYDVLMGEHRREWLDWRAEKTREFVEKIVQVCKSNDSSWPLYLYPQFDIRKNSPFLDEGGTRESREAFLETRYREAGFPLEKYKESKDIKIVPYLKSWAKFRRPDDQYEYVHGWNNSRGARDLTRQSGTIYLQNAHGLDEIDNPASLAEKWLWKGTARGAFTPRFIDDNSMNEFVQILSHSMPETIFYNWLDCNMNTGFNPQLRRFSKAFYSVPDADFTPIPSTAFSGVFAESAVKGGKMWLKLVNNSPYRLSGTITADTGKLFDEVYDRDLNGQKGAVHQFAVELLPNDLKIISLKRVENLEGAFSFSDEVSREIRSTSESLIAKSSTLDKLPTTAVEALKAALADDDMFAAYNVLISFEVSVVLKEEARRHTAQN